MQAAAAYEEPAGRGRARFSFLLKILLALSLVVTADRLFYPAGGGATIGLYAGLLLLAAFLARPGLRRTGAALVAAGAALLFAFALLLDPSPLAALLFWGAASLAVLLPRSGFDDGWRWAQRLVFHAVLSGARPILDYALLRTARRRGTGFSLAAQLPLLALPLIGSLVFLALFAGANPLIGNALSRVDWSAGLAGLSGARTLFWIAATVLAWSLLRPALLRLRPARGFDEDLALPGVSRGSVTLSLICFNLVFALQNGLDLAFLWSGAPLPGDLTLAEYAHRGAYPLIVTALLAGLFVLVTLRPGSDLARAPLVRRLVLLWIAQNLLLVASTMLRTLDYIEAYSLTVLRLSALLWMALVALGLVLICWRLWFGKSGAWLINANLLGALVLLAGCAFVDLGAVAAAWNVRHAREAGGRGAALDLCYLNRLGDSALLAAIALETRPAPPALAERLAWLRNQKMAALAARQADWRLWTVRGARRLEIAQAMTAAHRLPRFAAGRRGCSATPPPPPVRPALTSPGRR